MNELIFVFDILSVLCQFAVVYFGYKIYAYNRLTKWWLALVAAFFIQCVRGVLTIFDDAALSSFSNTQIIDRLFMFDISLLILIGLLAMTRNFESFEFLEKKVRDKLKK